MACYLRDCIGDLEKGEQGTFSLGNSLEATGDLEAEYCCLFVHFVYLHMVKINVNLHSFCLNVHDKKL